MVARAPARRSAPDRVLLSGSYDIYNRPTGRWNGGMDVGNSVSEWDNGGDGHLSNTQSTHITSRKVVSRSSSLPEDT